MNARVSQYFGGRSGKTTIAAATTITIPDNASVIHLTGTASISTISVSDQNSRSRVVTFIQDDTGVSTFVDGSTIRIGANVALNRYDAITMYLEPSDGYWTCLSTNN